MSSGGSRYGLGGVGGREICTFLVALFCFHLEGVVVVLLLDDDSPLLLLVSLLRMICFLALRSLASRCERLG